MVFPQVFPPALPVSHLQFRSDELTTSVHINERERYIV